MVMVGLEIVVAILPLAAVAYVVADRINVPYPVLLVSAGLLVGALPWVHAPELSPDVVFTVFLPPLLYYAAYFVSPSELRAHAASIGLLAAGLVIATVAAAVAALALLVPALPLAAAVAAGAVVAPTDPVAATAVFRRVGAPERLVTIVEGEGLINDGAALVVYGGAVAAAVAGSVHVSTAAWDLLVAPAGGVVFGLGCAWLAVCVRRRLDEPLVEITISLFTPYLTYLLAESVGLSGILATVAAGTYVGSRSGSIYGASSRLRAYAFLDVLVFLLNSVLFTVVGFEVVRTVHHVPGLSAARVAAVSLAVVAVVVGTRLAWLLVGPFAAGRRRRSRYVRRERVVVGWSGMRGGVSLAAALALPQQVGDGSPFPFRGLIIVVAAAVIVSTLVVQGTTLPWLLRRLRVGAEDHRDHDRNARLLATQAALDRLEERTVDGVDDGEAVATLRTLYTDRLHRLEHSPAGPDDPTDNGGYDALRLEMIATERAVIMALHDEGRITNDVLRRIERDLDLEESRVRHG